MSKVRAKKHLGQHFLTDLEIAQNIAHSLDTSRHNSILEVGPGMGVLTKYLLNLDSEVFVIEIDKESVRYLKNHFPKLENHIIEGDFLQLPIEKSLKIKSELLATSPIIYPLKYFSKLSTIKTPFQKL
jgi:16S rRNA (adenine1518-N6/adenine1519-N6)-dimethyltransferase